MTSEYEAGDVIIFYDENGEPREGTIEETVHDFEDLTYTVAYQEGDGVWVENINFDEILCLAEDYDGLSPYEEDYDIVEPFSLRDLIEDVLTEAREQYSKAAEVVEECQSRIDECERTLALMDDLD